MGLWHKCGVGLSLVDKPGSDNSLHSSQPCFEPSGDYLGDSSSVLLMNWSPWREEPVLLREGLAWSAGSVSTLGTLPSSVCLFQRPCSGPNESGDGQAVLPEGNEEQEVPFIHPELPPAPGIKNHCPFPCRIAQDGNVLTLIVVTA